MPGQQERPQNQPDPAESRERADPAKEAGLGKVRETRNTPVNDPVRHEQDRAESKRRRERSADDETDQSEAVDPTDPRAHGGHRGDDPEEATGKRQRGQE